MREGGREKEEEKVERGGGEGREEEYVKVYFRLQSNIHEQNTK